MKHKYKIGDRVILNLYTSEGTQYISKSQHGKEFTIIKLNIILYGNIGYSIKSKDDHIPWHVTEPMLTLSDPQMVFTFMKD